jgi:Dyp-type peroxidase family
LRSSPPATSTASSTVFDARPVMEKIEWEDIQGLVRSGYSELEYSTCVLWRFLPCRIVAAKAWLRDLSNRLTRAVGRQAKHHEHEPADVALCGPDLSDGKSFEATAINLALTATGLCKLGLSEQERRRFSREFLEGMAPERTDADPNPRRCNLLGDVGESSPQNWHWGGWGENRHIDGLLLLYAARPEGLDALVAAETRLMDGAAQPIAANAPQFRGRLYCDRKEHFGFRDGISQPIIDGTPKARRLKKSNPKEARLSVVKPGEFVIGYPNERGKRISSCARDPLADPATQPRELLRNGTYLVFRQLEQDVKAFDAFVSDAGRAVHGDASGATKDWVAARLIGRWPSGEPLIPPSAGPKGGDSQRNDFLYQVEDKMGLACPLGAHIRRANPRDMIGPDADTALRLGKMHRLIRRGRPYGDRPTLAADGRNDQQEQPRGMLFICLNADIAGQFEHIQHTWLNNPHFAGLCVGSDPLSHFRFGIGAMTIQHRPANLQLECANPFVTVRGGAYFFLPGIEALRLLAR